MRSLAHGWLFGAVALLLLPVTSGLAADSELRTTSALADDGPSLGAGKSNGSTSAPEKSAKPGAASSGSTDAAKQEPLTAPATPAKPLAKPAVPAAKPTAPSAKPVEKPGSAKMAEPGLLPEFRSNAPATGDKAAKPESTEKVEKKPAAVGQAKPEAPKAKPVKPLAPLSEELQGLRDRVRWTLAAYFQQSLSTQDASVTDIINLGLAYGCQSQVLHNNEKLNGITCLCWNYTCGGYEPLTICEGRLAARIGYGMEVVPGQFIAMLALARVPGEYPARVGDRVRKVSDIIEYEKLNCRAGADQSLKLLALAHYLPVGASWQSNSGQTWSIERLCKEELALPVVTAPAGGTYRLMGISEAVEKHCPADADPSSALARARKFVADYHGYAFKVQNSDGSWNPAFFTAMGPSNDQAGVLRASGHIAEWLAMSLPEEKLESANMIRAITFLNELLGVQQVRWNIYQLNSQQLGSVMHGLHALAVYDQRVFKPRDSKEPPAEAAKSEPAKSE